MAKTKQLIKLFKISILLLLQIVAVNLQSIHGNKSNTDLEDKIKFLPSCLFACGITNPPLPFEVKITEGIETGIHEFPWTGYLIQIQDGSFVGGATLITDQHLLTAASLVNGLQARNHAVVLGDHDRSTFTEASSFAVHIKEFILHPQYRPAKQLIASHDIAIVHLRRRVSFTTSVRPICLPWSSLAFAPQHVQLTEKVVSVVGWGFTDTDADLGVSDVLQTTDLRVTNHTYCQHLFDSFNTTVPASVFCAIPDRKKKSLCTGDVGGSASWNPRTAILQIHIYFIVGIIIPSKGCGSGSGSPRLFTRVDNYLNFITRHTNIEAC